MLDEANVRVFVDGTYEGDLMAAAGVNWTIGREGRQAFAESLAGKQYPKRKSATCPRIRPGRSNKGRSHVGSTRPARGMRHLACLTDPTVPISIRMIHDRVNTDLMQGVGTSSAWSESNGACGESLPAA